MLVGLHCTPCICSVGRWLQHTQVNKLLPVKPVTICHCSTVTCFPHGVKVCLMLLTVSNARLDQEGLDARHLEVADARESNPVHSTLQKLPSKTLGALLAEISTWLRRF